VGQTFDQSFYDMYLARARQIARENVERGMDSAQLARRSEVERMLAAAINEQLPHDRYKLVIHRALAQAYGEAAAVVEAAAALDRQRGGIAAREGQDVAAQPDAQTHETEH
jgi:DNA-binding transcriptional MocR family regulator